MKTVAVQALALLLAGTAYAQTPPQQTPPSAPVGRDLTRDLNAAPPAPAVYLAPAPDAEPAATPTTAAPRAGPSRDRAPAAPVPATATATETPAAPPPAAPAPTAPAPSAPPPAAPSPAAPVATVLDAAARAALPFSVDLPPGFEIVTGRPGPDFRVYTIRRGERSFAMVYAGPASQFPIYSGQMVEAGGRASVVSTENGIRHAKEHLFQRATAPREVHVWTMSLEGADRALAEQIAQSLDVR